MKPWKQRLVLIVCGGGFILLSSAFTAYRYAKIGGVWSDADFWWSFRIGIALTIGAVLYFAFSKYD